MNPAIRYFCALLLGASLTLAYAPFGFWYIAPIALAGAFFLLITTKDSTFKLGYVFGLGWFGAGVSWVHVSIATYGGLPLIGSLALMALLSGYLALYPAMTFWLSKKLANKNNIVWLFTVLWLLTEWLRSWLLTGFPWLSIGYSQINSPISGWLPVIGEFGLSGLLVLSVVWFVQHTNQKRWAAALVLPVIALITGAALNQIEWTKPSGESVGIAMVQGNIEQELRWVPEQDAPTMRKYVSLSEQHWHNQILIWPEAAVPKIEPVAQEFLFQLDQKAAETQTGMITGIVNYNFETRQAHNNLIGLGLQKADDTTGQYRYQHSNRFAKHHLLPIGEFIPMEKWLRGLAPIFDLPMSSFSRGSFQQNNLQANGFHLAPAICFEIAFPRQVRANLYADTDFIITVSNDAWFGDSHGPAQHLEIAQVRAKEFGMPVLRATNNGITAFVDHRGNIQSRLPQFQAAVIEDDIALVQGTTPYHYGGDWLIWILIFLMLLISTRASDT